ncbi:MAG: sulfurtransferase, partial [Burkholderiaceae bacterium]
MHPLVSVETLASHLYNPDWIVLDCRHDLAAPEAGEAAYRKSHIPGARFAHLDRDLSGAKAGGSGRHPLPTRESFAAFLAAAGVNRRSTLVAYDASNGLHAA